MTQTTQALNAEVGQREDFGQAEEYFLEVYLGRAGSFLHHLTYGRRKKCAHPQGNIAAPG